MLINLLEETLSCLKDNEKTWDDVLWVGFPEYKIDKDIFRKLADIRYNNGYGAAEVRQDLVVVGKDFWLAREEYDGSEWWGYRKFPVEPIETGNPVSLV